MVSLRPGDGTRGWELRAEHEHAVLLIEEEEEGARAVVRAGVRCVLLWIDFGRRALWLRG